MLDVEVIEDPAGAVVALDPVRARLLAELSEPRSAAMLAEQRRWGGLTERLLIASAASYVVSPGALGAAASGDPARTADPLSAHYLIAVAARIVREVGALVRRRKQVATFALDTEIRFASPRRPSRIRRRADPRCHRAGVQASRRRRQPLRFRRGRFLATLGPG